MVLGWGSNAPEFNSFENTAVIPEKGEKGEKIHLSSKWSADGNARLMNI